MMDQLKEYEPRVGMTALCRALSLPRATAYRLRAPKMDVPSAPRPTPSHALSEGERQAVLDLLHDQRFRADTATWETNTKCCGVGSLSRRSGRGHAA